MPQYRLKLNRSERLVEADPQMPLLWVLRDSLGMSGTKFGCGIGQCGCCTVLLDDSAVRSCQLPVSAVQDMEITTIEGLSETGDHPAQQAWRAENTAQCGYCQAGQIMSAVALLRAKPNPTDADIDAAMVGNLCRCGTYKRIRKSIHRAAAASAGQGETAV